MNPSVISQRQTIRKYFLIVRFPSDSRMPMMDAILQMPAPPRCSSRLVGLGEVRRLGPGAPRLPLRRGIMRRGWPLPRLFS